MWNSIPCELGIQEFQKEILTSINKNKDEKEGIQHIQVKLPSTYFYPDIEFPIEFQIRNASSKKLSESITLTLQQTLSYIGEFGTRKSLVNKIHSQSISAKIVQPNSNLEFSYTFIFPQISQPIHHTFSKNDYASLKYSLVVKCSSSDRHLVFPVFILPRIFPPDVLANEKALELFPGESVSDLEFETLFTIPKGYPNSPEELDLANLVPTLPLPTVFPQNITSTLPFIVAPVFLEKLLSCAKKVKSTKWVDIIRTILPQFLFIKLVKLPQRHFVEMYVNFSINNREKTNQKRWYAIDRFVSPFFTEKSKESTLLGHFGGYFRDYFVTVNALVEYQGKKKNRFFFGTEIVENSRF